MASDNLDVEIIIPQYQTLGMTRGCVGLILMKTDYPSWGITVVDNGSTDGSLDWLRAAAATGLFQLKERPGAGRGSLHAGMAFDLAILASGAQKCVAFHTDTEGLRKDWLTFLNQSLGDAGAVGRPGFRMGEVEGTDNWVHPSSSIYLREPTSKAIREGKGFSSDGEGRLLCLALRDSGYQVIPVDVDPYLYHVWMGTRLDVDTKHLEKVDYFGRREAVFAGRKAMEENAEVDAWWKQHNL